MIRKIAVAAATAALALGGIAVTAGTAGAAKPPPFNAHGNLHCSITGKVKITPALTNANTLPSTTSGKLKGTCSGTSGNAAVTPSGVKASVSSVGTSAGNCTSLATPGSTPFTVALSYKALGGKINPSTVVFPGLTPVIGATLGFQLNNGDVTGSYAGNNNADATATLAETLAGVTPLCSPTTLPSGKTKPAKGIKKLTVVGGTLDITS